MTQIALITGGQQGIGLGIAEALIAAGFKTILASRSPQDSSQVQAALEKLGQGASYFQHDLQNIDRGKAFVDHIEGEIGEITTFVSNAGVPAKLRSDMLDLTPDSFDCVHGVNLRGAFFLTQEIARRMVSRISRGYQSIIFVTSVSAVMASIERAEYCISKAGASMMAELFAVRLAPHGIGVFELRPGIIETNMTSGVKDKYTALIKGGLVPAQRWGSPADIGDVVVPLATGKMAFANGAVIPVDGGLSIARL